MDASSGHRYRGRFAPSPTGPLHFGSLVAAVGSFADARQQDGAWLVRIEDLDQQRAVPGANAAILKTLEAFGLWWDETLRYQSARAADYDAALEQLRAQGMVYACACSRRETAEHGLRGPEGPIYSGRCRQGLPPGRAARSERLRVERNPVSFRDRIQGHFSQDLAAEVGDFVLRRADGSHAYQLAVVVDDAEQGITTIVRGADLLLSTPRQIYLQRLLGQPTPAYAHLPLALDQAGRKLSKSLAALPINANAPLPALERAWHFLGQRPLETPCDDVEHFWQQAIPCWDISRVPVRQGSEAIRGSIDNNAGIGCL